MIAAQDQQIQDQAQQILVLTARGDSYKAAWEASAQEASSLRLAHEAALHLAHAERWRGRIEGLVVGLGVGYVGGKL